jgi:tetratricopeptide (TPR) repeat protein
MSRYNAALRCLQRAVELNPESEAAYCWLGWTYQQLQDYTRAVSSFERAIQIRPSCAYAHAQMGRLWVQLNRHQDAVDELLRAFRMNPKYEKRREYLLALGSAYAHLDFMKESVGAYEKASRLFPNDGESVYCYGWSLSTSKQFAEAEQVLRRAVALEPDKADAHYNLGIALGALGKWN